MKWRTVVVTAIVLAGLSATEAKAQSITIKVDASIAKQITVTATIAGLPAGWTVAKVYAMAPPTGGKAGQGGQAALDKQPDGTYKGTIFINAGTYDVTGVLWVNDNNNNPQFPIYSARTNGVTVNAQ